MWKKYLPLAIFLTLLVLVGRYRFFIPAFIHHHFVNYDLKLPQDRFFVVRGEGSDVPRYIKHIIERAFPEYKVTYNNDKKPHLVVKNVYRPKGASIFSELKEKVPYISFSPEKGTMKGRRYRATGYPFYEFVSFKTHQEGFSFIPFVAYSKNQRVGLRGSRKPVSLNDLKQRRDLVYVYSHCVAVRDSFFKMASHHLNTADSWGKCVNNQNKKAPGSYNDLKELYSRYKFVVAMEHEKRPGYVTEKILNAYEANAIPIYWGDSDTVKELFNEKSYIDLSSFKNHGDAIAFLATLASNEEALQSILSEPIFTAKGEMLLSINDEKLPPQSDAFLSDIAKKIRQRYFEEIQRKRVF